MSDKTEKTPIESLMDRMDAHDTESGAIDTELARLGLDKRKINSIRSTKARLQKEQEKLAALTGAA